MTTVLTLRSHSGFVLPASLFPTLVVLAAKYIVPNFTKTSLASEIGSACTPGLSVARPYIGHEDFDKFMCRLVAFFDFSLQPESEALTVLLFLAERGFLFLSPISSASRPGTQLLRGLYVFAAVVAAIVHLGVVLPNLGDVNALRRIFVPHVVGTRFEWMTGPRGALNTLQWDGIFIFGAAQIASLWFGRNLREVLGLLAWNVVGGTIIGPGSALAAVYAWREGFIGA
jgi:hypothetical protein